MPSYTCKTSACPTANVTGVSLCDPCMDLAGIFCCRSGKDGKSNSVRIFHGRLSFDKYTDRKYRWITEIDGVNFKLYVTEDRVPKPHPQIIEVSIFQDQALFSNLLWRVGSKRLGDLNDLEKGELEKIGLNEGMIITAGKTAIFGAVNDPHSDHTETARYNAYRHAKELEFGDPYIPKSVFISSLPERLLFVVRWIE